MLVGGGVGWRNDKGMIKEMGVRKQLDGIDENIGGKSGKGEAEVLGVRSTPTL